MRSAHLVLFAAAQLTLQGAAPHYVGPNLCAGCHKGIAANQTKTAMARTWRAASALPFDVDARTGGASPSISYEIRRAQQGLLYSVEFPGGKKLRLPVQVVMGGKRHGLGFLARISQVGGIPLQRPALIQARYFWSPGRGKLFLAPGLPSGKPQSLERALGLVLAPDFEKRCLTCHGEPGTLGAGKKGGVHCETCHGPGSNHLLDIAKGRPSEGIINPATLSPAASIVLCAQCHSGFGTHLDPSPADLLIANQVTALRSSECFIQSGGRIACTTCHNPHRDAGPNNPAAVAACLSCHSASVKPHAGICPVNRSSGCIGCHMPTVQLGRLGLIDHLIRVHPEQHVIAPHDKDGLQTQIRPRREYLRLIALSSRPAAGKAAGRLAQGESFYSVAETMSTDPSAAIGGYLGAKYLSQLDPAVAAAAGALPYGGESGAIKDGNRWVILRRMPRDFRYQAAQLLAEANTLLLRGDSAGAVRKAQQALMIYPYFLRALGFIGRVYADNGEYADAAKIFGLAAKLYPADANALFNLGLMLEQLRRRSDGIQAYRQAVQAEPDFVAAYIKLGMALYSDGNFKEAAEQFRHGLNVDPLSADLYYNLSIALGRSGNRQSAKQAFTLAMKIDPSLAR
ncbi:MAG: tetratricopeptide repeat protein [Bryobacteraceae bacterium]